MNLIETLEREAIDALTADKPVPEFRPGDTLRVGVKVIEGDRTRVQNFEGVCIARANKGVGSNFTVRKISFGRSIRRSSTTLRSCAAASFVAPSSITCVAAPVRRRASPSAG
jgi:ribosomal protein L19